MAITRTPIVDDDGSGTTGTVLDNAWKQELYTQIDAALPSPTTLAISSYILASVAGVNNNYLPTGGEAAVTWYLTASAGSYITGIPAPAVPGTQHLLINYGASGIVLSNAHTGSLAANRLTCPGYADYTLASWYAVWLLYSNHFGNWIVLKP